MFANRLAFDICLWYGMNKQFMLIVCQCAGLYVRFILNVHFGKIVLYIAQNLGRLKAKRNELPDGYSI